MNDDSYWMDRAQSAEAKYESLRQANESALERVKQFKANFGVRELGDGSLRVDYDKFANALGIEGALELRRVIDETYSISGAPGDKPRVKAPAA